MTDANDVMDLPASPSGGSKSRVLLGCGIGCGLLVFVVIIFFVGMYFLGNKALTKMDVLSKPYLEREYPVWKEEGTIKDEQAEVYDGLYDAVFDEELGSRWVTICTLILLEYHTDDRAITDAEMAQAKTLLDDIHAQPGLGFQYWGEFIQSDEGLQEYSRTVPLLVQQQQ